jgi:hypothetical protein
MTRAVLHLALERGVIGEFSAMDLAEHGEEAHGGSGIAGSVFRQLAEAQIIAPVGAFIDGEFYQRRVRNAAGNPVGVWRLAEHGLAAALLERMGGAAMRVDQLEMEPDSRAVRAVHVRLLDIKFHFLLCGGIYIIVAALQAQRVLGRRDETGEIPSRRILV